MTGVTLAVILFGVLALVVFLEPMNPGTPSTSSDASRRPPRQHHLHRRRFRRDLQVRWDDETLPRIEPDCYRSPSSNARNARHRTARLVRQR